MKNSMISVYVHMPFCITRCSYCDFNTYAGLEHLIPQYFTALEKEIEAASSGINPARIVHTLYFGGGSPSIVPVKYLKRVIKSIKKWFQMEAGAELTIEVNPLPLSQLRLKAFKDLGFNRLSIGMQSANDNELSVLGRRHRNQDTIAAVKGAHAASFKNINLDLIYGFPTQTLSSFTDSLQAALDLEPTHMSLYGLGLHEGTKMHEQIQNGSLPEPDDDLAADMYQRAGDFLGEAGFDQYEISNWSKGAEHISRHNLQYWHNENYLGFGAGAHSHYNIQRWENYLQIPEYIKRGHVKSKIRPYALKIQDLSLSDEIQETMIMGLRLVEEGISLNMFEGRFGKDIFELYEGEIKEYIKKGLLEIVGDEGDKILRLTKRARILGNQVFQAFIID